MLSVYFVVLIGSEIKHFCTGSVSVSANVNSNVDGSILIVFVVSPSIQYKPLRLFIVTKKFNFALGIMRCHRFRRRFFSLDCHGSLTDLLRLSLISYCIDMSLKCPGQTIRQGKCFIKILLAPAGIRYFDRVFMRSNLNLNKICIRPTIHPDFSWIIGIRLADNCASVNCVLYGRRRWLFLLFFVLILIFILVGICIIVFILIGIVVFIIILIRILVLIFILVCVLILIFVLIGIVVFIIICVIVIIFHIYFIIDIRIVLDVDIKRRTIHGNK